MKKQNKRNIKKNRKKIKKRNLGSEFKKYPNVEIVTMSREESMKIGQNPDFERRIKNEESQKKESRFIGKRPIECLELNGYEVLRDPSDMDSLVVFIDNSYDFMEGVYLPKEEFNLGKDDTFPFTFSIKEKLIEDYSSLWEITITGWFESFSNFFKGEHLYPYLYVRKKESNDDFQLWRWDNSNFLRVNCLTHNWSKENYELCEKFMLKNSKFLYDRVIKRERELRKLYS